MGADALTGDSTCGCGISRHAADPSGEKVVRLAPSATPAGHLSFSAQALSVDLPADGNPRHAELATPSPPSGEQPLYLLISLLRI